MAVITDNGCQVAIQVFEGFEDLVSESWLTRVARCALSLDSSSQTGSVSIVVADDDTVRDLNKRHRGLNEHTDVLAFSFSHHGEYYGEDDSPSPQALDTEFVLPPGEGFGMGEVIISFPQAERQAGDANRPVQDELASLLAHGILHLLGYDHTEPAEEAEMKAMEADVLARAVQDD